MKKHITKKELENVIDLYCKAFWNLAFRNTPLEDFHANKEPIDDEKMRILSKYAYNAMYKLFKYMITDKEKFTKIILAENFYFPCTEYDKFDPKSDAAKEVDSTLKLYDILVKKGYFDNLSEE